jgi:hypothetical protein
MVTTTGGGKKTFHQIVQTKSRNLMIWDTIWTYADSKCGPAQLCLPQRERLARIDPEIFKTKR